MRGSGGKHTPVFMSENRVERKECNIEPSSLRFLPFLSWENTLDRTLHELGCTVHPAAPAKTAELLPPTLHKWCVYPKIRI